MRFWDSSALVPLFVAEPSSSATRELYENDPELIVWWLTEVECASAVTRRERSGDLSDPDGALDQVKRLAGGWRVVDPVEPLRRNAIRAVRAYGLTAADGCQLAAALVAAEGDARSIPLVTLDDRLADAARREGFTVIVPS